MSDDSIVDIGNGLLLLLDQQAAFERFERLEINRPPVRSLGFGHGIHFCIGAALARMESQVTFDADIRRLPDLKMTGSPPEFRTNYSLRRLKTLPLKFSQVPG